MIVRESDLRPRLNFDASARMAVENLLEVAEKDNKEVELSLLRNGVEVVVTALPGGGKLVVGCRGGGGVLHSKQDGKFFPLKDFLAEVNGWGCKLVKG